MFGIIFTAFLGVVFLFAIYLMVKIKISENQVNKLKRQRAKARADLAQVQYALRLLELNNNPTKAEIELAYKDVMRRHHPDRGGSQEVAAMVNKARDLLVKEAA